MWKGKKELDNEMLFMMQECCCYVNFKGLNHVYVVQADTVLTAEWVKDRFLTGCNSVLKNHAALMDYL